MCHVISRRVGRDGLVGGGPDQHGHRRDLRHDQGMTTMLQCVTVLPCPVMPCLVMYKHESAGAGAIDGMTKV